MCEQNGIEYEYTFLRSLVQHEWQMSHSSASFPFANELGYPLLENSVTLLYYIGQVLSLPDVALCLHMAGLVFLSFKNTHHFILSSPLN